MSHSWLHRSSQSQFCCPGESHAPGRNRIRKSFVRAALPPFKAHFFSGPGPQISSEGAGGAEEAASLASKIL